MPREFSNYRGTLNLSYELDLFGRLRSGVAAARAELEASEASRDAVRLALAAQVAKSYFSLRSFEQQVLLTKETLRLREEALGLQRKRRDAGVISEFELRQLEAESAAARAQLPPLERERSREESALAVLLGRSPAQVFEGQIRTNAKVQESLAPPVVPSGLPSGLLLRRPDLVEAERALAAANARVAVARSEMFPSISLTAALGAESASLSDLFTGPAGIWSIAAALTQPIFAGGRLEARSEAAQARERAALARYQQAIRSAFGEVRTALVAQTRARESHQAESARVARIEALRAQRAAVADLFRALGG